MKVVIKFEHTDEQFIGRLFEVNSTFPDTKGDPDGKREVLALFYANGQKGYKYQQKKSLSFRFGTQKGQENAALNSAPAMKEFLR